MEPSAWSLPKLLGMLGRVTTNAHRAYLAETGLTPAAYRILEELDAGPLAQVEIARAVLVEAQTMGRTLARLERDGLVERVRCPHDIRRILVSRTAAGDAVLAAARTKERAFELEVRAATPAFEDVHRSLLGLFRHLAAAEGIDTHSEGLESNVGGTRHGAQ